MVLDQGCFCIYIADTTKTVSRTIRRIVFEWDEAKAAGNPLKHDGITFEEAVEVFFDLGARWVDASRRSEARPG